MSSQSRCSINYFCRPLSHFFSHILFLEMDFPGGASGKEPAWQCRRPETQVQSLGQEDPLEEGTGNPLWYSCLENLMDRGAWRGTVYRVTKSWTWQKGFSTHTRIPSYNKGESFPCSFEIFPKVPYSWAYHAIVETSKTIVLRTLDL